MKHTQTLIAIFVLIGLTQCRTIVEYVYTTDFVLQNNSDTGLSIQSWNNGQPVRQILIPEGQSFSSTFKEEIPLNAAQFWSSDSIEIRFDDGRKLTYFKDSVSPTLKNLLTTDDWSNQNISERHTKESYDITSEHYNKARK